MKSGILMKSRTTMRILATVLICTWLPSAALGAAIPPPDLLPLNQIPVPEPPNLFQFVKSKPAAIQLGKALFWDMQVGSNGAQACASCHFHAGADNRLTNTVNPGTRGGDTTFQVRGPNQTLLPSDFPFHQRHNPEFQSSSVLRDANDVVGSQGIYLTQFTGINPGSMIDSGTPVFDPVFQAGGTNTRRVTARNTPSNINAVFNFNNFWDGRAHFVFNGVNPFGPLDPTAGVWFNVNGTLVKKPVVIEFASLASQATGPPLDDTEMSFSGRTFPELGRKMLSLVPLADQLVHPNDSVLGPLSNAVKLPSGAVSGNNGLSVTYDGMIRDAFVDTLWNSPALTPSGFTQMEANFSLFWGLAIQLYEATLVSDQTPFDRFLGGDTTALTLQQQDGFNLFFGAAGCSACHLGTELTSASVRNAAFVSNASQALIEAMTVASGQQIIYDNGFNNTAVRPTTDDIARGGTAPFTNSLTGVPFPLSYSLLAELQAVGSLGFNPNLFPPGIPATPILPVNIPANFPVANDGNFKVSALRNIELTAPYFHDGGVMTLDDVVDFYTRGGNFPIANRDSLDPDIVELGTLQNAPDKQAALVAFMMSMTDERVRKESAPFDHPEIFVPVADSGFIQIPAKDANGVVASTLNVTIDPVVTPTANSTQLLTGAVETGLDLSVTVDTAATVGPVTISGSSWSAQVTGLVKGLNTITVTASHLSGDSVTVKAVIKYASPPVLTINPVTSPTASSAQTISGTVEAGVVPVVIVTAPTTAGPVTTDTGGANWSCEVSGLAAGVNSITVVAADAIGTLSIRTATVTFAPGDGDANMDGRVDIADALIVMRIAVGLVQPGVDQKLHSDVAPQLNGKPAPDNKIDITDALLVLKKVVGLVTW